MKEVNIMEMIDNKEDILSEIIGFCGGSYIMSGRVSKKWNGVYKMRNKTTTTSEKQCTTIDSIWELMEDERFVKSRARMLVLFDNSLKLSPVSTDSTNKIVRIKKPFIVMFRWGDTDLIQYSNECVRLLETDGTDREFIGGILENIINNANEFNQKSVMFMILDKYYRAFPDKKGCNVFTSVITNYRYIDILVEYVERYEYGNFNMNLINESSNEALKQKLRDRYACTRRIQ